MTKKNTKLAKRIKRARVSARLSQKELGKIVKLTDKAISAYEVGRAEPSLDVLKQISKATHTSIQYFTSDGNEQEIFLQSKLKRIEEELAEVKKIVQDHYKD